MYTRFKSKKAGIKHGLNQIANSTRSRVEMKRTPTVFSSPKNDTITSLINIKESKSDILSLSMSSTSSQSSSSISSTASLIMVNTYCDIFMLYYSSMCMF